jgi:hypothetical protein
MWPMLQNIYQQASDDHISAGLESEKAVEFW